MLLSTGDFTPLSTLVFALTRQCCFASEREHCVHSFFLFLVFTHLLLSRMGVKVKRKANLVKFWASCHIQPRSMDYCLCPPPPTRLYFACIYLRGTGSVDSAITGFRPQSCSGTVRAGFTNSHLLRDTGCVSDSHLLLVANLFYAILLCNILP